MYLELLQVYHLCFYRRIWIDDESVSFLCHSKEYLHTSIQFLDTKCRFHMRLYYKRILGFKVFKLKVKEKKIHAQMRMN